MKIRSEFSLAEPITRKKDILQAIEAIDLFGFSKPSTLTAVSLNSLKLVPSKEYGDSPLNSLIEREKTGRILITHKGVTPEYAQCYISDPLIS